MGQERWRALSTKKRTELRKYIYQRDQGTCWRCHTETTLAEGDLDHLIEQRNDPDGLHTTDRESMRWACRRCNRSRGNLKKSANVILPKPSRIW